MWRLLSCFIGIIGLCVIRTEAQMIPAGADTTVVTAYSVHDSVYVFHQLPASRMGKLAAHSPYPAPSTFAWHKLDPATFLPDPAPLLTENGVTTSALSNLRSGGYTVNIQSPGYRDTSFTGWILQDTVTVALNKDGQGNLAFGYYTCLYLSLINTAHTDSFVYANPATQRHYTLRNRLTFRWWGDPATSTPIVGTADTANWVRIDQPPYENTTFYSRATNSFGLSAVDQVYHKSILPKADFDTTDGKFYVVDPVKAGGTHHISAPFEITFVNNSKNAVSYTWIFGNGDTLHLKYSDPKDPTEKFIYPDSFNIRLIARSADRCIDSTRKALVVEHSTIETGDVSQFPNFFTPNGDGFNDRFKFFIVSLKEFTISIYSRTGKKVYEYHGYDMHDWDGWDGKINGADASEGVYFYIIEAKPWDKHPDPTLFPANGQYKGYLHLFRGK